MKYCKRCGTLYNKGAICTDCNKPLTNQIDKNEPVYIISAYGFERTRIISALQDSKIPCIEKKERKENSCDDITSKAINKVRICVPYCAYDQAIDILIGIGAIKTDAQILDENTDISKLDIEKKEYTIERKEEKNKGENTEEFEEMNSKKRNLVRVLSAISFIILVALAIYGVDFIAELIKTLANGGQ